MNIHEVAGQLQRSRPSRGGYTASCPCTANHKHGDRTPSLRIDEGDDGKVLLNCFVGCTVEEICSAKGWKLADLFPSNGNNNGHQKSKPAPEKKEAQAFSGSDRDEEDMQAEMKHNGELQAYIEARGISQKVATDLKWGFAMRKFAEYPEPDRALPSLATPHYTREKLVGIKFKHKSPGGKNYYTQVLGSEIHGLYAAHLLDPNADEVLILEGPEDIALALTLGFNAAGLISASSKLGQDDVEILLRYKRIYLIGDQDPNGQKAMNAVAEQLPADRIIRPHLPYKDIGEMRTADPQSFAEKLRRILRLARASRPAFGWDDLLREDEIRAACGTDRYVVDRLVPQQAITMVFGEEKAGKSQLLTYLGKCVANGARVFGKYQTLKANVLVLDLEASDGDISDYVSHFQPIGPEQIRYLNRTTGVPPLDSPALLSLCEQTRPLLIMESLTKFADMEIKDGNGGGKLFDPAKMSGFFDKVLNLCRAGASVIISHHAIRTDVERYANSHQIGAAVQRAYAVISHDHPRLGRVRLEGKLARGAEPASEDLIAFPVIAETGHFGLQIEFEGEDLEKIIDFVRTMERAGKLVKQEDVKKGVHMQTKRAVNLVKVALTNRRLTKDSKGFLHVPESGNACFENERSDGVGTDENDEQQDLIN